MLLTLLEMDGFQQTPPGPVRLVFWLGCGVPQQLQLFDNATTTAENSRYAADGRSSVE